MAVVLRAQDYVWVHSISDLTAVMSSSGSDADLADRKLALQQSMAGLAAIAGEDGMLAVQVTNSGFRV